MNNHLHSQLQNSKQAACQLSLSTTQQRNKALLCIVKQLQDNTDQILAANKKDLLKKDPNNPMLDRLLLTAERIEAMCKDIQTVIDLNDPLNIEFDQSEGPSGIQLKKITVPLGTIGIIYESRPNVTVDISALSLKSGNTVILRGGSDAYESNTVLCRLIRTALKETGLDENCVQLIAPDRDLIPQILTANDYIDLIIPRGGKKLIQMVRDSATVPTIETGASVVHTYVDKEAELQKSVDIIVNEKMRRPSVCNAIDTVLIHTDIAEEFLTKLAEQLKHQSPIPLLKCDKKSLSVLTDLYVPSRLEEVKPKDFSTEFLDYILNVKIVKDVDEAIAHIQKYSLKHSEAICTDNPETAKQFKQQVDAACVYVNTSTCFSDGAEFGLGAEIGISTQKMHARGPMALKELTSYKWLIDSDYLTRP